MMDVPLTAVSVWWMALALMDEHIFKVLSSPESLRKKERCRRRCCWQTGNREETDGIPDERWSHLVFFLYTCFAFWPGNLQRFWTPAGYESIFLGEPAHFPAEVPALWEKVVSQVNSIIFTHSGLWREQPSFSALLTPFFSPLPIALKIYPSNNPFNSKSVFADLNKVPDCRILLSWQNYHQAIKQMHIRQ